MHFAAYPTHLAKIACCETTHMGFCDTLGVGVGVVGIDPYRSGLNLLWRHHWLLGIIAGLLSLINMDINITNSDLDLAALVLNKATLLLAVPTARMALPCSGLDNMPTFSWSMHEA